MPFWLCVCVFFVRINMPKMKLNRMYVGCQLQTRTALTHYSRVDERKRMLGSLTCRRRLNVTHTIAIFAMHSIWGNWSVLSTSIEQCLFDA